MEIGDTIKVPTLNEDITEFEGVLISKVTHYPDMWIILHPKLGNLIINKYYCYEH